MTIMAHQCESFHVAARLNHIACVQSLCNDNYVLRSDSRAMRLACDHGNYDMVVMLHEYGGTFEHIGSAFKTQNVDLAMYIAQHATHPPATMYEPFWTDLNMIKFLHKVGVPFPDNIYAKSKDVKIIKFLYSCGIAFPRNIYVMCTEDMFMFVRSCGIPMPSNIFQLFSDNLNVIKHLGATGRFNSIVYTLTRDLSVIEWLYDVHKLPMQPTFVDVHRSRPALLDWFCSRKLSIEPARVINALKVGDYDAAEKLFQYIVVDSNDSRYVTAAMKHMDIRLFRLCERYGCTWDVPGYNKFAEDLIMSFMLCECRDYSGASKFMSLAVWMAKQGHWHISTSDLAWPHNSKSVSWTYHYHSGKKPNKYVPSRADDKSRYLMRCCDTPHMDHERFGCGCRNDWSYECIIRRAR